MSKVVVVRLSGVNLKNPFKKETYLLLLKTGLKALSNEKTTVAAIKKYIPSGTVGMKINCLAGKLNSTPIALTEALVDLLVKAGLDENDIIIWERTNRELIQAGYKINASSFGYRCLGTDTNGVGYSREFYSSGEVNSLVSRILTDSIKYNINLPVLKDHSLAGLSGGLKNMFGAIHNPNKFHDNNCDPYAADISNLEPIRKKHRLSIIDAIKVQCNGGPGYDSRFVNYYNGLIISDDPVAADRIGLEILENFRETNNLPNLEETGRPVKYLKSAEKRGIGSANISKINLSVIKVDRDGHKSKAELFK